MDCEYYHPGLSSQESSKLLNTFGKVGSFLVRDSQSGGKGYTLCIK